MMVDDIRRCAGVVMLSERMVLDWSKAVLRTLYPLPVPSQHP